MRARISKHALSCDHARHLLIEDLPHHRHHGYTCTHSLRGTRDVHLLCTDTTNPARPHYSAGYRMY